MGEVGTIGYPDWWEATDVVIIDLAYADPVEVDRSEVELFSWGVATTSGWAWPWHVIKAIYIPDE